MIQEYRHRRDQKGPTTHAVKVTEENAADVAAWCGGVLVEEINPFTKVRTPGINVKTRYGGQRASLGMYVLRDVEGYFEGATAEWFEAFFVLDEDAEAADSPDRIDRAATTRDILGFHGMTGFGDPR